MTNAATNESDGDERRYRVLRYREDGRELTMIQDRRNDDSWTQTNAGVAVRE